LGLNLFAFCASAGVAAAVDASVILKAWDDVCLKNAAHPDKLAAAAEEGGWPSVLNQFRSGAATGESDLLGIWAYRASPEPILLWPSRSSNDGGVEHQCAFTGEVATPKDLKALVENGYDVEFRKMYGSSLDENVYYHPVQFEGRDLSVILFTSKESGDGLVKLTAVYRVEDKRLAP